MQHFFTLTFVLGDGSANFLNPNFQAFTIFTWNASDYTLTKMSRLQQTLTISPLYNGMITF